MGAGRRTGRDPGDGAARRGGGETVGQVGEFPLIARIERILARAGGSPREVVLGPGDDAAVLRPEPGWDLVVTCDTLVAGRHFLPEWSSPRRLGRRAMMVNLSDVAAMGADPLCALISLGLPPSMPLRDVEELYAGFLEALAGTGASMAGGNVTATGPEWFCDLTLIGRVERGRALLRSGARPGDRILVTGSPGRSAAGLACLRRWAAEPGERSGSLAAGLEERLKRQPWARPLVSAYLEPTARLAAGRLLGRGIADGSGRAGIRATAAIDLSDGLPGDLLHICERSGHGARIEIGRLPQDASLEQAAVLGRQRWEWSLLPSDDYELLFTAAPADAPILAGEIRREGLEVTDVGEITERGAGPLLEVPDLPAGASPPEGWDHYRRSPTEERGGG